MEDGLIVICSQGHLSADYVINALRRIVAEFATAAGEEMAQSHDNLAVIYIAGVMEARGANIKMSGGLIGVCFILTYYFVAHFQNTSFQVSFLQNNLVTFHYFSMQIIIFQA